MIGDFSFNGQHLSDLGAVITDRIQYPISEREMELIPIPGKSGDVILDKKRFKNIPLAYKISHVPTFSDDPGRHFAFRLSEWLTSSYEYGILRESYTPGYFYKAVCPLRCRFHATRTYTRIPAQSRKSTAQQPCRTQKTKAINLK